MNFLEIFEPGLKYLREEKDRQRILVIEPSHGGGAPLGIDLDAGTAKIIIAAGSTTTLTDRLARHGREP
jgi:hypothetical protein